MRKIIFRPLNVLQKGENNVELMAGVLPEILAV